MSDRKLAFPVKVEVKARGVVKNPPPLDEGRERVNDNRTQCDTLPTH
jgi:hypothetical protein